MQAVEVGTVTITSVYLHANKQKITMRKFNTHTPLHPHPHTHNVAGVFSCDDK